MPFENGKKEELRPSTRAHTQNHFGHLVDYSGSRDSCDLCFFAKESGVKGGSDEPSVGKSD